MIRKPIRAVAIVIKDQRVLLMYTRHPGEEYYVFPGGGVEDEETVEEAVLREIKEETMLQVKIEKLLYHHHYPGNSDQYFYLCTHLSGEPVLGEANEKEEMSKGSGHFYQPMWVEIEKIDKLLLYPLEIRDWLLEDVKNNFKDAPKKAEIDVKDLRQTL